MAYFYKNNSDSQWKANGRYNHFLSLSFKTQIKRKFSKILSKEKRKTVASSIKFIWVISQPVFHVMTTFALHTINQCAKLEIQIHGLKMGWQLGKFLNWAYFLPLLSSLQNILEPSYLMQMAAVGKILQQITDDDETLLTSLTARAKRREKLTTFIYFLVRLSDFFLK